MNFLFRNNKNLQMTHIMAAFSTNKTAEIEKGNNLIFVKLKQLTNTLSHLL